MPSHTGRGYRQWLRDLPSWLIFLIVAVSPLPFGSVSPVAIALYCCVAGCALIGLVMRPQPLPSPWVVGVPVLVVVLAYALIVCLQVAPRPFNDPLVHPIWSQASDLLGQRLTGSASIARDQPYYAVGAPLLALLMLVCGYICGADERLARRLLNVAAWSGLLYAIFAICSFAIEPTMVLWQQKLAYTTSLTGTFTNRNTAAVYFGSIAIIWLTLAYSAIEARSGRRRRSRRKPSGTFGKKWRRAALPFSFFMICLIALLLSSSRAGAACTFIGIAVSLAMIFQKASARTRRLMALLSACFVILLFYQVFDSGVGERLQMEGVSSGGRFEGVSAIIRMISDFPWLGTGIGTFRWSFTSYRSSDVSVWGIWDKAHNVPLEIAAEGGVALAAVVLLFWIGAVALLALAMIRSERPLLSVRVALPISLVAGSHALVDFSLQIPAFAILAMATLGAGLAEALRSLAEPVERVNPDTSAVNLAPSDALKAHG